MIHPCPWCNPAGVPARYSSLAEEAHAHVRWLVLGCPNHAPWSAPMRATQLLVRYFDRRLFSRSGAWEAIVDIDGGQYWRKSHTAGTWCWYAVLS